MKRLWDMIQKYHEINTNEDGVSLTKDEFNELYDEINKDYWKHISDKKTQLGKGLIIGSASVGLIWLGVETYRWVGNKRHETEIEELLEEVKEEKASALELDDDDSNLDPDWKSRFIKTIESARKARAGS